jgi:predicted RNase H-like HicB family nuclease
MKQTRMRYTVLMDKNEIGGYTVTVPSLPGCISQGDNWDKALKNIEVASNHWVYRNPEDPQKICVG